MKSPSSTHARSRGQSLVEAAITLPIVLLLSLGVSDLGRAFFYREAVTNSVRQALRIAVSSYQHGTADNVCGGTSGGPLAVTVTSAIPPSGGQIVTIANQASLESSKDGTPSRSVLAGSTLSVTFHCLNGAAITNATSSNGAPNTTARARRSRKTCSALVRFEPGVDRLVVPDQGHILDEDRILMSKNKGQALVEFALVFPLLFFILAISIDVFRVDWVTSTVAEAARQAARQAVPNQVPPDNPFGSATGSCSGTTLTPGANGAGCMTNNRIDETVDVVMGTFSRNSAMTEASPSSCPTPAAGATQVCIWPFEQGAAGTYADCAAARSALGRDPMPGDLGARAPEYANPQYKGCFEVVVTVIYRYDSLVPFLGSAAPNLLRIASSTTMLAEY